MKIKIISIGILVAVFGFSNESKALIDAQAMLGTDTSKLSDGNSTSGEQTYKGNAIGAAVHLDPIPLIPIGFGLAVNMPNSKATIAGSDYALTGLTVDLEVMAWTPISLAGITPFVKLGFAPYSAYTLEGDLTVVGQAIKTKMPLTGSGSHFAVGASFSIIPLISLLLQISNHSEKLKFEKVTVQGQTLELKSEVKRSSTQMLIGLEVGI